MQQTITQWVKYDESLFAKLCRQAFYTLRNPSVPAIGAVFKPLLVMHRSVVGLMGFISRVFYYTPMFKTQLCSKPKGLYLYSGMPQILGKLDIKVGDNTRISGISTFCGRSVASQTPQLRIGNNVDIGWQNSISVGTIVDIRDNVRLAGKVFLAGFPGHPIDAADRRRGLPETDQQAKDIILEDDVWVGTGATILAGVRVGRASIVAAGAVVTKDVPENCIVAGNPAKVVKQLGEQS
ncbi:acyltransferase [Aestuariibacter salexigens]|uniref:acyltransferase n=1 Tax=Aestuariibacter salexigens TaxID=226010 RepID=UPI0004017FCC|nr:acyltransferase [Aestuariibacter salexigens]